MGSGRGGWEGGCCCGGGWRRKCNKFLQDRRLHLRIDQAAVGQAMTGWVCAGEWVWRLREGGRTEGGSEDSSAAQQSVQTTRALPSAPLGETDAAVKAQQQINRWNGAHPLASGT